MPRGKRETAFYVFLKDQRSTLGHRVMVFNTVQDFRDWCKTNSVAFEGTDMFTGYTKSGLWVKAVKGHPVFFSGDGAFVVKR